MPGTATTADRPASTAGVHPAAVLFMQLITARARGNRAECRRLTGLLRGHGWSVCSIRPRPSRLAVDAA